MHSKSQVGANETLQQKLSYAPPFGLQLMDWKPTTVRRLIKSLPTSAGTILVETDAGQGFLKPLGNPEGPHILACEWVATQLAAWLGLSTFDFAVIDLTEDDEIAFAKGGFAEPGPAFISRAESGATWSGTERELHLLANPKDIGRLVVFDTWTLNCDRHSPRRAPSLGPPRVNRDNVFLSEEAPAGEFMLKAMDHTHCFTCGKPLTRKLRTIDKIQDERVFGLFPEFRGFLERASIEQTAESLRAISRGNVRNMLKTIPRRWEVSKDVQDALEELIVRRATFVASGIADKLWPQRELGAS